MTCDDQSHLGFDGHIKYASPNGSLYCPKCHLIVRDGWPRGFPSMQERHDRPVKEEASAAEGGKYDDPLSQPSADENPDRSDSDAMRDEDAANEARAIREEYADESTEGA